MNSIPIKRRGYNNKKDKITTMLLRQKQKNDSLRLSMFKTACLNESQVY